MLSKFQTLPRIVLLFAILLCVGEVLAPQQLALFAQSGPELYIAANLHVTEGDEITVPVGYRSHANDVAAVVFSIDFDETCLALDLTDADQNGRPDAIRPLNPTGLIASIAVDLMDTDGEIDVIIADYFPPFIALPDSEALLLIAFSTVCQPPAGSELRADVLFSTSPSASFGDSNGQSLDGMTINGGVTVESKQPAPTSTPLPTATQTPMPTATIVPTRPSPTATATFVPTAIPATVIDYLHATPLKDGVYLEWQSSQEINTKSFSIHRLNLTAGDTAFTPLSTPVVSMGTNGGTYHLVDSTVEASDSYSYLLVEEKTNGRHVSYYDLLVVYGAVSDGTAYQLHLPIVLYE